MKNIAALLFLLIGFTTFGQGGISILTGEKLAYSSAHFQDFLAIKGTSLYTMGSADENFHRNKRGKDYYLRTYDIHDFHRFRVVNELEIPAEKYMGNKTKYFTAVANEEGFHLLTECFNRKKQEKYLLHQRVSMAGEVSEIRELASMTCRYEWEREFIVRFSEDHSNILIYADIPEESEDQIPKLWVYNEDFSDFWSIEASEGLDLKTRFSPTKITVSNDGEAFIMGFQRKVQMLTNKVQVVDQYSLIKHAEGGQAAVFEVDTPGKMVHHMNMDFDEQGMVQLIGMSSEVGEVTPKGCVFIKFNPKTMEPVLERWQTFDTAFMAQFPGAHEYVLPDAFGGAQAQGQQKRLKYFQVKEIVQWEDGSSTAIGERTYRIWANDMRSVFYEELIVMDFNAEGKLNWVRKIPKFQRLNEKNYGFGSVFVQQGEDELYLIYNDEASNPQRLVNGENVENFEGAFLNFDAAIVMATITRQGDMAYSLLDEGFENNTLLLPRKVFQITPRKNLGVLISPGAGKLQFFKMTID